MDGRWAHFEEIEARWKDVRPEPWSTLNHVLGGPNGAAYPFAPLDVSWLRSEVRRLYRLRAASPAEPPAGRRDPEQLADALDEQHAATDRLWNENADLRERVEQAEAVLAKIAICSWDREPGQEPFAIRLAREFVALRASSRPEPEATP